MVVREMVRRCDFDPDRIDYIRSLLNGNSNNTNLDSDSDRMVHTLWAHYESTGYLSARILDYLSRNNVGHIDRNIVRDLLDSLPKKPFKVVPIHDCFRCLPHYGNDLREQYNIQLMLIAKSNILQSMLNQITGQDTAIGKLDPNMWKDIMKTEYALS